MKATRRNNNTISKIKSSNLFLDSLMALSIFMLLLMWSSNSAFGSERNASGKEKHERWWTLGVTSVVATSTTQIVFTFDTDHIKFPTPGTGASFLTNMISSGSISRGGGGR